MTPGRAALWLAAIYLVSVILRYASKNLQSLPMTYSDEIGFMEAGRSILGWSGVKWSRFSVHVPNWIYPLAISLPIRWMREKGVHNGILLLNAVMVSTAIPLTYGFARRLLSRERALIAAGLTGLMAGMTCASLVMAENVYFPMAIAGMWAALAALDRPSAGRRIAAGVMFGMLYHAKPQGLFFPIFFGLAVLANAFSEPGLDLRSRLRLILPHWLTALAWAAAVSLRFVEAWMEKVSPPISLGAFLGNYAQRAEGVYPLDAKILLLMIACNCVVVIVATGILPALRFARNCPAALRGGLGRPERQLTLLTAAAAFVTILACARHTVVADIDHRAYERYLTFLFPPMFILFLMDAPPLSRFGRGLAWAVAIAATAGALADARWRMVFILGDIPTFSGYWLTRTVGESLIAGRIGLGILAALFPLGLIVLAASGRLERWRSRLPALCVAWLLLIFNYGYYAAQETGLKPIARKDMQLAAQVRKALPEGARLMILCDGLPTTTYFQLGFLCPGETVYINFDSEYWFAHELEFYPDGRVRTMENEKSRWLFAEARWPMSGKPKLRVGRYNLYDLSSSAPPRMDMNGLNRLRKEPKPPPPGKYDVPFPKEIKLSFNSIKLPKSWRAGEKAKVSVTIRNEGDAALKPGPGRIALSYHWGNPTLTGSWNAVVWDSGFYELLPDSVAPGESARMTLDVLAPPTPAKDWLLTITPVLIGVSARLFPLEPDQQTIAAVDLLP